MAYVFTTVKDANGVNVTTVYVFVDGTAQRKVNGLGTAVHSTSLGRHRLEAKRTASVTSTSFAGPCDVDVTTSPFYVTMRAGGGCEVQAVDTRIRKTAQLAVVTWEDEVGGRLAPDIRVEFRNVAGKTETWLTDSNGECYPVVEEGEYSVATYNRDWTPFAPVCVGVEVKGDDLLLDIVRDEGCSELRRAETTMD